MSQIFMFITGVCLFVLLTLVIALQREVGKLKSHRIGGTFRATRQTPNGMIDIDLHSGEGR